MNHQIFKPRKLRIPKTNSILKVYKLVLKISPENFSSQKIKKFLKISPKSPKKKPSPDWDSNFWDRVIQLVKHHGHPGRIILFQLLYRVWLHLPCKNSCLESRYQFQLVCRWLLPLVALAYSAVVCLVTLFGNHKSLLGWD